MKYIILALVFIYAATIVTDAIRAPAALEHQRAIDSQHEDVLSELTSMGNKGVDKFVSDWRRYYADRDQTSGTLVELNEIRNRIARDTEVAVNFTIRHQKSNKEQAKDLFTPVVGWSNTEIKPGIHGWHN